MFGGYVNENDFEEVFSLEGVDDVCFESCQSVFRCCGKFKVILE